MVSDNDLLSSLNFLDENNFDFRTLNMSAARRKILDKLSFYFEALVHCAAAAARLH